MSQKQAAAYVGVCWHSIRNYIIKGIGPKYYVVGKVKRFTKEDLDNWLMNGRKE
jgi:hypothetical protein